MRRKMGLTVKSLMLLALSTAVTRAGDSVPDARTLGVTEGILSFCAKADAGSVARIKQHLKELSGELSKNALARVRSSADYRAGYQAATDFTDKVDPHNAAYTCSRAAGTERK